MPLKLYYCQVSPPSRFILNIIRVLKLKVEIIAIDLHTEENLKPEFLAINPQHCVPTLDDDGFILWESRAIASYLCSKYDAGGSLYPRDDIKETAKVERMLYFDAGYIFPHVRNVCAPIVFKGQTTILQQRKDRMNQSLELFNTLIGDHKWAAGGEKYSVADISLYSCLIMLYIIEWDFTPFPNVLRWIHNCASIPGSDESKQGALATWELMKKIMKKKSSI